jgi:predicted transcriptional regulator
MSTATLRIDDSLRERIARLAAATDQTPHSFMVKALAEKVDEAEWRLAMQSEAHERDAAIIAGEPTIEWHEMRDWLQREVQRRSPPKRKAR